MSTQEEAAGEGAELSAVRAQELVRVNISSMTGHEWSLNITPDETVQSLKEKIWRHCGLLPYHQGLIFAEESLTDRGDQLTLRSLGVRQNSTIRLVVVTRSGPLALHHPHKSSAHVDITTNDSIPAEYWNGERIFDERFLEENRRKLLEMCELQCQMKQNSSIAKPVAEHFERRVISAPEDTSAKESSAGDTECDDEKIMDYSSKQVSQTSEALPLSLSRNSGKRAKQNLTKAEDGCISSKDGVPSARDRLLVMMQARATSSSTDVNTHSEDGSEFSSGMIICDLSNEFRRLRVRRKHHATGTASGALQKARARSKPRAPAVTLTHQHRVCYY